MIQVLRKNKVSVCSPIPRLLDTGIELFSAVTMRTRARILSLKAFCPAIKLPRVILCQGGTVVTLIQYGKGYALASRFWAE